MTDDSRSPYEITPPSAKKLLISSLFAIAMAAVLLVAVILPSEYGIDPTGIGSALGLTALAPRQASTQTPAKTPEFAASTSMSTTTPQSLPATDSVVPEPVPLPNPEVHQSRPAQYRSDTIEIRMAPEEELEYKAVLQQNQVMVYSWQVDKGDVYFDFHADAFEAPQDFWVRYQEGEGSGANGSLTAPFGGNHGWYWLNYNDFPVTIRLQVSGYYDELKELGRSAPQ